MKDLHKVYMELASSLERTVTRSADKRHAAILLRNHAIGTPHCSFCSVTEKEAPGALWESRYLPKVWICKLCSVEIAEAMTAHSEYGLALLTASTTTTETATADDSDEEPAEGPSA